MRMPQPTKDTQRGRSMTMHPSWRHCQGHSKNTTINLRSFYDDVCALYFLSFSPTPHIIFLFLLRCVPQLSLIHTLHYQQQSKPILLHPEVSCWSGCPASLLFSQLFANLCDVPIFMF